MNHSAVSASRCNSCHNGSYTGEGTKGAQGTASYPGHVATGGRDCITCHANAATSFTSWAGGTYVHLATDTNCSSCHNGTTALGMTTPPHIPSHRRPVQQLPHQYGSELPTYTMNHAAVSASRCDCLSQRLVHGRRHEGCAGHRVLCRPRRDGRPRLRHLSCQRGDRASPAGRAALTSTRPPTPTAPACHNGTTATGMTTPPHIPIRDGPVQQLPHQHGGELHDLHDDPFGGQRQPLRLLSQWRLHQPRNEGRLRHGVVFRSRSDERPGLQRLPCERRHHFHQLGGRNVRSPGVGHELHRLPQRYDRDRYDHAAAHSDRHDPVQQLSHQHRGELHHLHDEPYRGDVDPLRRLPQRLL